MPRAADARHGVLGLPPLLALAAERGLDGEALLREVGVAPSLLADVSATVPVERVHALVRLLLARTGDPTLGLDAGRHYHPSTFGLLGAVASVAPTAREVIDLFVEYTHLTFTFFALDFDHEDAADARLVFVAEGDLGELHRFYLDRELAFVYYIARHFWPDAYGELLRTVELDYPAPPEADRYRAHFPCPVRFGADQAAFHFDLRHDRARAEANRLGLDLLKEHLRSFGAAKRDGEALVDRVRREMTLSIGRRHTLPDAATIAAALGLSERGLRRRLSAEGQGFRALADEALTTLAKKFLRDSGRSVAEVAERLGYAEPASFVRAFRRVTGTTPDAFRGRQR